MELLGGKHILIGPVQNCGILYLFYIVLILFLNFCKCSLRQASCFFSLVWYVWKAPVTTPSEEASRKAQFFALWPRTHSDGLGYPFWCWCKNYNLAKLIQEHHLSRNIKKGVSLEHLQDILISCSAKNNLWLVTCAVQI